MAINSETLEKRVSSGSFESFFVTLDIQSFTNPESYDPTDASNAGNKYVNTLQGISVLGVENGDSLVVQYDHLANEFNVVSHDGTAAASDVGEVRIRIDGDVSA
jgi:hypothetical protein